MLPEISEADLLGLDPAASERIKTPRLASAPIALEIVDYTIQ